MLRMSSASASWAKRDVDGRRNTTITGAAQVIIHCFTACHTVSGN